MEHIINIEVENSGKDYLKGLRYYIASSETSALRKGQAYGELPERILITLSSKDLTENGETFSMYQFMHFKTKKPLNLGLYLVFVNSVIKDGQYTEIEKIFSEVSKEDLDSLNLGIIKDIYGFFKRKEEGKLRLNAELQARFDRDIKEALQITLREKDGELREIDSKLKEKDNRIKALEKEIKRLRRKREESKKYQ